MALSPRAAGRWLPIVVGLAALTVGCGSTANRGSGSVASSQDLSGGGLSGGGPSGGATATTVGAGSGTLGTRPTAVGANALAGVGGSNTGAGVGSASAGVGAGANNQHTPLSVGIIVSKCSNCDILPGYVAPSHSEQDIWQALVSGANARGGIGGRTISPVWAAVDTNATDWNVMFQSVCATFTQDHHVAVVLGASFGYSEVLGQCLANANVLWIDAGFSAGNQSDLTRFPAHFNPNNPSNDVAALLAYTSAVDDGWLTPKATLGVIRSDCPADLQVWNETVAPYLRKHSFHVKDDDVLSCTTGAAGYGTASSQIQNAELHMRVDGIDTVAIRDIPLVAFASDAESQHWNPKYLSVDDGAKYEPYLTSDQIVNVHDAGWLPYQDVDAPKTPGLSTSQKDCLAELMAGGLTQLVASEYAAYFRACSGGWLYLAGVLRAGGAVATAPVVQALAGLGNTFVNPEVLDQRTLFGSQQHTGPVEYRSNLYDTTCSCFRYSGPPRSMPTGGG